MDAYVLMDIVQQLHFLRVADFFVLGAVLVPILNPAPAAAAELPPAPALKTKVLVDEDAAALPRAASPTSED